MGNIRRLVLTTAIATIVGCAAQTKLSDAEIASRYPDLAQLHESLKSADNNDVDLLSAALYQQANKQYAEAVTLAQVGDGKTNQVLSEAQSNLTKAINNAQRGRDELASVLKARNRALSAAADKKNPKDFQDAEQDLVELGNMIAKGEIADVREERQALVKRYAVMEVAALKSATAKDADDRIKEATRLGADDYAPQTLKQAASELKLANSVLETNADAREKAADHAQRAYGLASRAIQITEIIKEFKQSRMTDEQIVLWYQTQLANAVAPVVPSLDFGQPNKTLVNGLALEIRSVVNQSKATEQSLAQVKQQYETDIAANLADKARQEEFESRFKAIQSTFSSSEAEVYRQGNNVLIRSYGFNFPPGSSEIQSENFPLLKKMVVAIGQFPNSGVQVSGHTDNRGSDELNMNLSSQRAEKVASFLVEVGNINSSRVKSVGYGKTRPLASNETAEGRAENRRVEILIIND